MDKSRFGKRWSQQRCNATRKHNAEKREAKEELKHIHEKHFGNDTREAKPETHAETIAIIIKGAIL